MFIILESNFTSQIFIRFSSDIQNYLYNKVWMVDILSEFQPLRPTSHQNNHALELFCLAHIEMKIKSKLPPNNMEAIPWTGEKQCRAKKRPPDIPEMFSPGKNIRFNFRPLACGANYCSPHFVQRTLWREKLPNVTFLTINQAGETN